MRITIAVLLLLVAVLAWKLAGHPVQAQVVGFDTGQISCAGTVTAVVGANSSRTGVLVTNAGSITVYIGSTAVTTGTGAYLPASASLSIPTRSAVSCISSGASQTVTYVESYQ